MTRNVLLVVLLALATAGAVAGAAGVATAQETATASDGSANETTKEVAAAVDDDVYVEKYWYNATTETFYLRLKNDGPSTSTVTITEAISRESKGERKFGIEVVDVGRDETVQTSVSAKRVDGAAGVMVLTDQAVQSGQGLYLQENKKTDNRLIKGGATGGHVRAGALAGGAGSIFLMILGAWQFVASKNTEVKDADLEPKTTLFGSIKDE